MNNNSFNSEGNIEEIIKDKNFEKYEKNISLVIRYQK